MSAVVAALLNGQAGGRPLDVFPGYCQSVGPAVVQITGDTTLTGLEYLGVVGTLVPGRVLLLRIPDARPVILGNLNS